MASSGSDLRLGRRSTFPPQFGAIKLLLTSDTLRVDDIFLVGHDCTLSTRKEKIFQCDFLPADFRWRGALENWVTHGHRTAGSRFSFFSLLATMEPLGRGTDGPTGRKTPVSDGTALAKNTCRNFSGSTFARRPSRCKWRRERMTLSFDQRLLDDCDTGWPDCSFLRKSRFEEQKLLCAQP